jgi:hypothetical protein
MVWFFSRASEIAQYEVRQPAAGRYELVVTRSDESSSIDRQVETFAAASRLIERSLARQEELLRDGWRPHAIHVFTGVFTSDALEATA